MKTFEIKNYFPSLVVVFVFTANIIHNLLTHYGSSIQFISFFAKFIVFVFFTFLSLKKNKSYYLLLTVLLFLFVVSQLTIPQFEIAALSNISYFFNYIYVFVLILGLYELVQNDVAQKILFKTILFIIVAVLTSIVIGTIFQITSFQTYYSRFGFKGVLERSSDASYFVMVVFLFLETFKYRIKYYKHILGLTFICCFLIGTKAPYLFLFLYFGYKLYIGEIKINSKVILGMVIFFLSLTTSLIFFFKKPLLSTFEIFQNLYKTEGIWAVITSKRSTKFSNIAEQYLENWSFTNYLFGGKEALILNFEYDFLDLFIAFGIVGSVIYIFLYYKIIFKSLSLKSKTLLLFIIAIAAIVGQFFYNTNIALFIAVIVVLNSTFKKAPES